MMQRGNACGAAATSSEDLDSAAIDAHPCRDLAIPFNDIETRPNRCVISCSFPNRIEVQQGGNTDRKRFPAAEGPGGQGSF